MNFLRFLVALIMLTCTAIQWSWLWYWVVTDSMFNGPTWVLVISLIYSAVYTVAIAVKEFSE